jgi:hypothetical protein
MRQYWLLAALVTLLRETTSSTVCARGSGTQNRLCHDARAGNRDSIHPRRRPRACLRWVRAADVGAKIEVDPEGPDDCVKTRFTRFTVDEARSLLAGRHVAIVGDSVCCYTYLAMVHFLHSGDNMRVWNATQRGHETPLGEMLWNFNFGRGKKATRSETWMEYYRVTSGDFHGAEICDCLRESCHPWCHTFMQNRYLRFGGGDRVGRVTFVPSFDTLPQRWHEVDFANWRLKCRVSLNGTENRMCDSLQESRSAILPRAPSDAKGGGWRFTRMQRVLAAFQPMDVILWNAITNWEKPLGDKKTSSTALVINNVSVTSAVERNSLCGFATKFARSTRNSSTKMLWNQLTSVHVCVTVVG